jgi:hypothetical protein
MKIVYSLREDLDHIAAVQAAVRSPKPFGFKATNALFGSDIWWQNIDTGIIPLVRLTGTIARLFRAGMQNESECFEMIMPDGQTFQYDCKVAHRKDRKLYQVGRKVEFCYVQQELKRPVMTTTGEVCDTHSRSIISIKIDET